MVHLVSAWCERNELARRMMDKIALDHARGSAGATVVDYHEYAEARAHRATAGARRMRGAVAPVVERIRQDLGDAQGRVTTERHCYISSLRDSRLRKGHGAENMSRLRRIVMNKLKTDRSQKRVSLKAKRYRCSLDRAIPCCNCARIPTPSQSRRGRRAVFLPL